MLLFGKKRPARTHRPQYARPAVEALESRLTPYAALGNAWPGPQLITISFVPDGTALGGSNVSNLFATMNARFGTASVWETQVLKAAQQWAQQTNINFALVSDDGSPAGSGAYEQGAPNFGDIRIGGYDFGNTNLGMAYQPPPVNNTSFAGDVNFNTGLTFSIGSGTDLFTAAVHEIGHALGLGHSAFSSSVMYASYNGVKRGLSSDDIAGIQSVYGGARARDAYGAGPTPNNTFATAANLNSAIDPTSLTALVTGLDITTTSTPAPGGTYAVTPDVDYYTFTAPTGASATGTLVLNVQSAGLSLLAPKVTVYAADQTTVLASANGAGHYGTTLSLTVNNVTDGQRFYVKVQGADNSALGSGAYALTLNFGTGPSPAVPLPNTTRAVGVIPSGGGGTTTVARVLVGDDTTPPEVVAPDGEPVWDNLTAGDTAGSAVPQGPSGATTPDNLAAGVMLASSGSRTPSAWTDSNNFATGALLDNGTTPTQSGQGQPGSTPSRPHGSGCGCPGCMAALLGYDFYEMTQDTAAGADPGAGQLTADAVLAADPTALLAT